MPKIKINATNISKIKLPSKGKQEYYWDSGDGAEKGFGIKATPDGLTYIVQKRVGRGRGAKFTRYKIGAVSLALSAEVARKAAAEVIRKFEKGINVRAAEQQEEEEKRVKGLTLAQAYSEVKEASQWSERSVQTFDENFERCLKDWHDLPLSAITSEMVLKQHTQLTTGGRDKKGNSRGKASADQAMRILRRIFNHVMQHKTDAKGQPLISKNPVTAALSQKENGSNRSKWNNPKARTTIVRVEEFPAWYKAIRELNNQKMCDFMLFLMFTGLRRGEAMRLKWDYFDIKNRILKIPAIIRKTDEDLEIPLTDVLLDIYRRRNEASSAYRFKGNPYIFQGMHGKGHLKEPKRFVTEAREKSGIQEKWSSHDLRRTYSIVMGRWLGINVYQQKYLMGHKPTDVTGQHYMPLTVDDVRETAQQIADFLKLKMGMQPVAAEAVGE